MMDGILLYLALAIEGGMCYNSFGRKQLYVLYGNPEVNFRMDSDVKLYLVEAWALPDVLCKTLEAKRLLESGTVRTVTEAIREVGISRSAFYKYRTAAAPFAEIKGRIVTLQANLRDKAGVLSSLLSILAAHGASILTINQNIPISGQAVVTIQLRTAALEHDMDALIDEIRSLPDVVGADVIAAG